MVTKTITTIKPIDLSVYGLCYRTDDVGDHSELPNMVFYFDEAFFHIQSESLFIKNEVETCMSIFPVLDSGSSSVFGSIAQESHIMQFDLKEKEVSFTRNPLNCEVFSGVS